MDSFTEVTPGPLCQPEVAALLEAVRAHQSALLDVLASAPAVVGQSTQLARSCVDLAAATRCFFDASRSMLIEHAECDNETRKQLALAENRAEQLGSLASAKVPATRATVAAARRVVEAMDADGAFDLPSHPVVDAAKGVLESVVLCNGPDVEALLDSVLPLPEPDVDGATRRIRDVMDVWWQDERSRCEVAIAVSQVRSTLALRAVLGDLLARLDESEGALAESRPVVGSFSDILAELEPDDELLADVPLLWQEDIDTCRAPLLLLDGAGLDSFWPGGPGRAVARWRSVGRIASAAGAR